MATNLLHYGPEVAQCFPMLRKAGYSIDCYERAGEFRAALEASERYAAVSTCELEDAEWRQTALSARARLQAPLILFRMRDEPGSAEERGRVALGAGADFDLVLSATAPPLRLITEIDRLVARSRALCQQSRRLMEQSAVLRREAAAVVDQTRREVERARSETARTVPTGEMDRVLRCADCGNEFVFTAGEQYFFQSRHFMNDPKQCSQCRAKRRNGGMRVRMETTVTCAECGTRTSVPFKPRRGLPVLCRLCFEKARQSA